MTLRLRRGTDLERQSVVFQEGELVYITDTKDLYAGDGTTLGGVKVSNIGFPSELSQNLDLNGYNISGTGTISATAFIGDGSGLTNLPSAGLVPGTTYEIGIQGDVVSQDNTLLVDSLNKIVYGTFIGDGSGLTGVSEITPGEEYAISIQGNVRSVDSSILVDSVQNRFNGTVKGSVVGFDDTILIDAGSNTHYGSFSGDGSQLTNLASALTDPKYNISVQGNVYANDDSLLVDSNSKTIYGTFVGDGSLLENISLNLTDGQEYSINIQGSVRGFDSSVIVDPGSNSLYGTFVGDGSLLTGLVLNQIDDIDIVSPQVGETLVYNGISWINTLLDSSGIVEGSDYSVNIVGFDSTKIINVKDNTILGVFRGIVNSSNGATITVSDFSEPALTLNTPVTNSNASKLIFNGYGGTFESPTEPGEFHRQGIEFKFYNGVEFTDRVLINSYYRSNGSGYLAISPTDTSGTFFNTAIELDGESQTILVTGAVSSTGTITAASFKGSIVADDSTTIIDAVNGTVSALGYIQFGSYTTSERDLLIASNGMVIYNSTANRFQGYQNNAWINLDDGTSA